MSEEIFVVPEGMPRSIFHDKYARKKEDGTFQTWEERLREVVAGNISLGRQGASYAQKDELERLAVKGVIPFSGRHVQHGDMQQRSKRAELFLNCTTAMFCWASFLLLMKGCGVGRDYSSDLCFVDWDYMPNCRFVLDAPDNLGRGGHPDYQDWIEPLSEAVTKYDTESEGVRWFEVEDSAEGWAKVVMILETAAFHKNNKDTVFVFDFSKVRPAGAPLKGQQNRPASGPVPFIRALNRVVSIKGAGMKPWKQAMHIDHYLAACVVVGGVRRSARIATKIYSDREVIDFIDIKRSGALWSANNSVLVDESFWEKAASPRPSLERRVYEAAGGSSYWDDTGEPGFINVDKLNALKRDLDKVTVDKYLSPEFQKDIGGVHPRTMDMIKYHLKRAVGRKYLYTTNPCVPADTVVLTSSGPRRVGELVGSPFSAVVDGQRYVVARGFWSTGRKSVLKVSTKRGYSLRLTANHKVKVTDIRQWVAAGDLQPGDRVVLNDHRGVSWEGPGTFDEGWLLGEIVGDGGHNPGSYPTYVRFWGPYREEMSARALGVSKSLSQPRAPIPHGIVGVHKDTCSVSCRAMTTFASRFLEPGKRINIDAVMGQGSSFLCGFLRGLFDMDGTVAVGDKGRSIRFSQSNIERIYQVQSLLLHIGIASTVYANRKPEGFSILPDGKGGSKEYPTKANHELHISRSSLVVFMDRVGFYKPDKRARAEEMLSSITRGVYVDKYESEVVSVEEDGYEEVYDCSVPGINAFDACGIIVHNCGEISLAVWGGYCNIGDICLANATTEPEAKKAAGLLARALVRVNTMSSMYRAEVLRTNRIGVSLTGIHEFMWRKFSLDFRRAIDPNDFVAKQFWAFIMDMRKHVEFSANMESEQYGLPHPASYTCIKPSGTISKVMQCTEGAHLPANRYYVRWVMFTKGDPKVDDFMDRGYQVRDVSQQYDKSVIVGFPTCLPLVREMPEELLVTAAEATPEEQYRWVRLLEQYWLGGPGENNQISFTAKWRKAETSYEEYMKLLLREQPTVRCLSLMPQIEQDASAYAYLPEEPVSREVYESLMSRISDRSGEAYDSDALVCEGGACPIEGDIHAESVGVRTAAN